MRCPFYILCPSVLRLQNPALTEQPHTKHLTNACPLGSVPTSLSCELVGRPAQTPHPLGWKILHSIAFSPPVVPEVSAIDCKTGGDGCAQKMERYSLPCGFFRVIDHPQPTRWLQWADLEVGVGETPLSPPLGTSQIWAVRLSRLQCLSALVRWVPEASPASGGGGPLLPGAGAARVSRARPQSLAVQAPSTPGRSKAQRSTFPKAGLRR